MGNKAEIADFIPNGITSFEPDSRPGIPPTEPLLLEPLKGGSGIRFLDVYKTIERPELRADGNGCWPFDPEDLMKQLLNGDLDLGSPHLQSLLLDWMESDDYNRFVNNETGQEIFAMAAKRGNVVYAARKSKKRDEIKSVISGRVFDTPVDGFRDRRMTRLLLCTVNFDRSKYSMEEAWAALRSTPLEGVDYIYNVLNRLNANITKIFGKHGTLICKEAQFSGYPAPHLIFVLDSPVMVQRHVSRSGAVSWRICDSRILDRIGKGPLMRKIARTDYRQAIDKNPIWKHGFIDFEGIVKGDKVKNNRDAFSYPFKYLTKCLTQGDSGAISGILTINEVADKALRTTLFTHLGNKCFRTRDISFGRGFKERIGMLPEQPTEGESVWTRTRTYTGFEYRLHSRMEELRQWEVGSQRIKELLSQGEPCRGIPS